MKTQIYYMAVVVAIAIVSWGAAAGSRSECIDIIRDPEGKASVRNRCEVVTVTVAWCVVDVDCKHGNWGMSNTTNLGPKKSYPVFGSTGKDVVKRECEGVDALIQETGSLGWECR